MTKKNDEIILEIESVYKKLTRKIRQSTFVDYKKMELHVHTPASHDYVYSDKNNTMIEEYKLLLNKIVESELDIIAITDHNNINGYEQMVQIINQNKDIKSSLKNKLLLPGVEIDCYGKHFLIIFDNKISIDKIKSFIYRCGLENRDDIEQTADRVTPLLLCEEVYKLNGIVILAHADADKGFMQSYFEKRDTLKNIDNYEVLGKSVQSVLNEKALLGVSLNSLNNVEICENLLNNWKIQNMKIIQASDSHSSLDIYKGSGKPLGARACWIKIGTLTFQSLKMSLKQQNSKIYFEKPMLNKKIYMYGIAVKGGFLVNSNKNKDDYSIFTFSPDLNSLIGPRGTGKSTIIEIIDYMMNFEDYYTKEIEDERQKSDYVFTPSHLDLDRYVINRFDSAIIFIKCNDDIYSIYSNPTGFTSPNIGIYLLDKNSNKFHKKVQCKNLNTKDMFSLIKEREKFKVKVYKQKDLQEMTSNSDGVTKLIDGLNIVGIGTNYLEKKMLLKRLYDEIKGMCKEMFKERLIDNNADWSNEELETKYKEYYKIYLEYIELFKTSIENLNNKLCDKLRLSYEIRFNNELLNEMSKNIAIQYERKKETIMLWNLL